MLKSDALLFSCLVIMNGCAGSANSCSHLASDLAKKLWAKQIPVLFCNLTLRNCGLTEPLY